MSITSVCEGVVNDVLCLDVLLLSNVFQAFRRTMIDTHGLDCLYFPSLPV